VSGGGLLGKSERGWSGNVAEATEGQEDVRRRAMAMAMACLPACLPACWCNEVSVPPGNSFQAIMTSSTTFLFLPLFVTLPSAH
jgi:hypothetical protein